MWPLFVRSNNTRRLWFAVYNVYVLRGGGLVSHAMHMYLARFLARFCRLGWGDERNAAHWTDWLSSTNRYFHGACSSCRRIARQVQFGMRLNSRSSVCFSCMPLNVEITASQSNPLCVCMWVAHSRCAFVPQSGIFQPDLALKQRKQNHHEHNNHYNSELAVLCICNVRNHDVEQKENKTTKKPC